jgi:hypothetical protein
MGNSKTSSHRSSHRSNVSNNNEIHNETKLNGYEYSEEEVDDPEFNETIKKFREALEVAVTKFNEAHPVNAYRDTTQDSNKLLSYLPENIKKLTYGFLGSTDKYYQESNYILRDALGKLNRYIPMYGRNIWSKS